jgi:hypothetical protein
MTRESLTTQPIEKRLNAGEDKYNPTKGLTKNPSEISEGFSTLGGNRTHTPKNTSLSRARLPIPPPRHLEGENKQYFQIVSNSLIHFCVMTTIGLLL